MGILNKHSLIETVDAFNEAEFAGKRWQDEARAISDWVSGRLGKPGAYAGSFAMTESDWNRPFRLFTGESITTRAGRSHIIAQETNRMLLFMEKATGTPVDALQVSLQKLEERMYSLPENSAEKCGLYCCGPCSVSVWRVALAGGYSGHPGFVDKGVQSLYRHRKEAGGWSRFPFYYTLYGLLGAGEKRITSALQGWNDSLHRRFKILHNKRDKYALRRCEVLRRIIQKMEKE